MKKISMFLFTAAISFSFVACGGSETKKEETKDSTKVETTTPTTNTESAPSGSVFDKFVELTEKSLELSEKASKGDAAATQELATIGQELQKITPEVAATLNNLTPEQKAKYEALVKKALEQAQKQQAK